MKKFLSIVAALAMLFALAVPAFAADFSITYNDDDVTAPAASVGETEDGEAVYVAVEGVGFADEAEKAEFEESLAKAVDQFVGAGAADVVETKAVEVTLKTESGENVTKEYFEENASLTVVFVVDPGQGNEVTAVLHQKADGTWESLDFTANGNNVSVTFTSLSPVTFVISEVKQDPGKQDPGKQDPGKQDSGKDAAKSHQTGYDTVLWTVAAAAMVLCAGYCFVSARKKAAE